MILTSAKGLYKSSLEKSWLLKELSKIIATSSVTVASLRLTVEA